MSPELLREQAGWLLSTKARLFGLNGIIGLQHCWESFLIRERELRDGTITDMQQGTAVHKSCMRLSSLMLNLICELGSDICPYTYDILDVTRYWLIPPARLCDEISQSCRETTVRETCHTAQQIISTLSIYSGLDTMMEAIQRLITTECSGPPALVPHLSVCNAPGIPQAIRQAEIAYALSIATWVLGVPRVLPFLNAYCQCKTSWASIHIGLRAVKHIALFMQGSSEAQHKTCAHGHESCPCQIAFKIQLQIRPPCCSRVGQLGPVEGREQLLSSLAEMVAINRDNEQLVCDFRYPWMALNEAGDDALAALSTVL